MAAAPRQLGVVCHHESDGSGISTLSAYRSLFSKVGVGYVLTAFIARLPLAMSQLGVLLLVSDLTDSYGAGGACAGAIALSNAVGAPIWGIAADRIGQRVVLTVQALGGAFGFALVLLVAHSGAHWGFIALACVLAGSMLPQVGPMSRVRWRPLVGQEPNAERLVSTAFSLDGAADEAAFVIGPALVGLGVAIADPSLAIALAGVLLGVFGTGFALHRTAVGAQARPEHHLAAGRLLTPALVLLCGSQLSIGMVFGSVQTGSSVLATDSGNPGLTGYLHALLGVGSVIAGLLVPALPDRFALPDRLRWFAFGLLLLALPLLLVHQLALLVPVLLLLGISVAPYMITTFSLGEQITPAWRLGTAMTLLAAATVLGYAVGASVAGQLADLGGETPAFAVTVAAGILAMTLSWGGVRTLRSALQEDLSRR